MYNSVVFTVPDTASYIRGWIQMVLAPNDLFSWNNNYNKYNEYNVTDTFTCFFQGYAHYLLCACRHLEAMKGSSSLTSCRLPILSCLSSSLIWAQLTLLVPALEIRSPPLQNGNPIHRVHAHSLTGVRNTYRFPFVSRFPSLYPSFYPSNYLSTDPELHLLLYNPPHIQPLLLLLPCSSNDGSHLCSSFTVYLFVS